MKSGSLFLDRSLFDGYEQNEIYNLVFVIEDYHEQQKRFTDPMDAVYYIYCHDKSASRAWS